jgi:signal transduction histidine kinase
LADVKTDLEEALPPVLCLPGEIGQVILNLIVNAAQSIGEKNTDGGQGLAIAETIVHKKHQGKILFESQPGVGTTFKILLPLQPAAAD